MSFSYANTYCFIINIVDSTRKIRPTDHSGSVDRIQFHHKTESEQNRCAMACQGCGAVCFFTLKMAVTGLSQDSIVKVRPITNFKHGLSPNNCL